MTAAQFEGLRVDEAAEVLAWRFDALCRTGYDLDAAAVIAASQAARAFDFANSTGFRHEDSAFNQGAAAPG